MTQQKNIRSVPHSRSKTRLSAVIERQRPRLFKDSIAALALALGLGLAGFGLAQSLRSVEPSSASTTAAEIRTSEAAGDNDSVMCTIESDPAYRTSC